MIRVVPEKFTINVLIWLLVGLGLALAFVFIQRADRIVAPVELSYSQFKALVEQGEVKTAVFRGSRVSGTFLDPIELAPGRTYARYSTQIPPIEGADLLKLLGERKVETSAEDPEAGVGWLVWLLPWVLIIGIWYFLMHRMSGGPGRGALGDLVGGRARMIEPKSAPKARFSDIAGQDNAKAEVSELLEFLRNPERYRKLGAEVPHGILLQGPPGTGKTLLARALAGEAQVPFFHISASEFIELFVGVGASRVRKLFQQAKENAPSIIFIDELDSVGRVRGAGFGGGHDEREQTLNQILAEMDGFEGHEAVVVLAATNRPDVLDPALLRPGRFDRHITLELPDMKARVAILQVHCRYVPLAADVDLEKVAAGAPGFSGADLKNLVNEAAMAAARRNQECVSAQDFEEMRDRIIMGPLRTMAIHEDERHRLAVHEAGHAAVAYYLPNADPIHKVTIIPRGRSLGGTHLLPEIERHTLPEEYLRDRLAVILAGRAAERLILSTVSSGADDDIRSATQLARWMVGRWGMSDELGPVDVRDSDEHPFLGREIAMARRFSEKTAAVADQAVRRYLAEAERCASEVLDAHRSQVEHLIAQLEKHETLERAAVAVCLGPKEVRSRRKPESSRTKTGQADKALK